MCRWRRVAGDEMANFRSLMPFWVCVCVLCGKVLIVSMTKLRNVLQNQEYTKQTPHRTRITYRKRWARARVQNQSRATFGELTCVFCGAFACRVRHSGVWAAQMRLTTIRKCVIPNRFASFVYRTFRLALCLRIATHPNSQRQRLSLSLPPYPDVLRLSGK